MRCVLCGRSMSTAAVFIKDFAVGPVCARRAGLVKLAARGNNPALRLGPASRLKRSEEDSPQMALELEVVA